MAHGTCRTDLGRLEVLARQKVMQDSGDGWAGLHGSGRQGALAIVRTPLVYQESIRPQMIIFAYERELGPVQTAFDHILGLAMHPLTWETDQTALDLTQPLNRAQTHDHLISCKEYLHQWDAMAVGGRGRHGNRCRDGREWRNRPKKRQKAGFEFRA